MSKTYVIGHTKPDTDAVVAAMALSYLYRQKACFGYEQPEAAIADPLNPETTILFETLGVSAPPVITADTIQPDDTVVLVDHNEASQRLTGLADEHIVEIVDHHKVNLNLNQPIFLTFKPWGSTSTIIYHLMQQNDIVPDKTTAALMLAAILSDTVGYKSSTTTDTDRELGAELAKLAEIDDVDGFILDILKAKSNVSALTDEQIVKNDYKVFEFGRPTMIDQLETVEQTMILTEKKAGLLEAMARVKVELGVELLFVAISDILNVNTKLLILSEDETAVAEKAFGGTVVDHVLDIGPKLSRKKEIAPPIEKALA